MDAATAPPFEHVLHRSPPLLSQAVAIPGTCSTPVDWELIAQAALPREGLDGRPIGGFSAVVAEPRRTSGGEVVLWLLSDAPQPFLLPIWGVETLGTTPLQIGRRVPLTTAAGEPFPDPLDGEGLVLRGDDLWIVSEGRRTAQQPAQLLRFDRRSGRLRQALELPDDWRAAEGRGLGANQGPESLTLLPPAFNSLLVAAERPLLQDPPGRVRLLAFGPLATALSPARQPAFRPLGAFDLPLEGPAWGLTDLLAWPAPGGPAGLLGLIRGYEAPARWWARLVLLPLPDPASAPGRPVRQWDLLAAGLTPDNWEGLAVGPSLSDGRPTLLVVSDDNFNPLQASLVARIAPRCASRP
jgi:hypothetical protein